MATNPDKDEFLEDDAQDELVRPSIFSAGWFRALLVLTALAIVVVVSLPYLLNWLEPTSSPPPKTQAKSSGPAPAPAPAPPSPAPTVIPAPATPSPSAKAEAPAPAPPGAKPEAPKPASVPVPAPATSSPVERPLATAPRPASPAPAAPAVKPAPAVQAEVPKAAPAPKRTTAVEGGSPGSYWVQVGAFLEGRNAEALAKQIRGENFPVNISPVTRGAGGGGATYHIVRVGAFADRTKAQQVRGELEAKGHSGFLTQGAAR
jgi:cell division septation protein DedD